MSETPLSRADIGITPCIFLNALENARRFVTVLECHVDDLYTTILQFKCGKGEPPAPNNIR
ncbi:hypothetical protein J2TS4_51340 [Paenibacillus sp. J2TS4]|nr:hypothetical protein J2TS4_51340 [Paenibacillus sp. J2TS4]